MLCGVEYNFLLNICKNMTLLICHAQGNTKAYISMRLDYMTKVLVNLHTNCHYVLSHGPLSLKFSMFEFDAVV